MKPLNKSSIFADASDDDNEEANTPTYGLNPSTSKPNPKSKDIDTTKPYTNLSALHSSRKHAAEASELDPTIYSYDAVYDSLHAKPGKDKKASDSESGSTVPKYMTSLLRSAEIRKRDQMRARDRLLAKEREAEGDEFADKEKFVTAAYKAQQEELRRVQAEEEAREKEEEERRKKNGGSGMVDFYRDMLSRGEERHEAVVKAAEEAAKKVKEGGAIVEEEEGEKEKSEAQVAEELNAKGAHIAVNDEGQVVDKRQLLSAGLNASRFGAQRQAERGGQRARQTEMIASQLEERARQEEEAEAARQKEIAERSRSRKTEGDVMSAKERYLARKREREAAAKKA
ncbi:Sedlin, N-terminal conserved region family protein [Aspergillus niger]|uniref:Sedlin, N-terminal conserved region family protein n=1 Tax=Aspergillus niger TaxID=5061 RepID=A0A505I422_ASPNG|nr:Sedlin, N-terminal conserved region family protein [Aspergillus niger]